MKTAMAKWILAKLCKPKSIYLRVMFAKLLSITEGLHRYLQGESLDLGRAAEYKMATVQTLTDLCADAGAEACGPNSNPTTSDDFRHQLFYSCLDRMIQELTLWFSDVGKEFMSGIQACSLHSSTINHLLSEHAHECIALHY